MKRLEAGLNTYDLSKGISMLPNEYQDETAHTEIYTEAAEAFVARILGSDYLTTIGKLTKADEIDFLKLQYCVGKLNGEAGEIAEEVFKAFRGGDLITEDLRQKLFKELGDVQWYVARIAAILGFTLDEVMVANIKKLKDRQERGVLHGYGNER